MRRISLLAMWILLLPATAVKADALYEVIRLTGSALVWPHFGDGWYPVEVGDQLRAGELLQMTGGTLLQVRGIRSTTGGNVLRGMVLRSENAVVTRVDQDSLRRLEVVGYFADLQGLDNIIKKKEEEGEEFKDKVNLRGGWDRLISLFSGADQEGQESPVEIESGTGGGSTVSDEIKEIVVEHPRDGNTYLINELPTTVAVSWTPPATTVGLMRVFLWHADRGGRQEIGRTSEIFYTLPIREEGRYYVSVESVDGHWRSKPHLFIITKL